MIRTVGIVSLSSGILGESAVAHEVAIGLRRLREYGLKVKLMPHAMDGLDELAAHPEKRASDLLEAFRDSEIDMILCAIGGDDTYRLLPFLFEGDELKRAVTEKVFLGFSDTTINHLMLRKVGLNTYYGQSFLSDVCELEPDMLAYTERYFRELMTTGRIRRVTPSDLWYDGRTDYGPSRIGTSLTAHPNQGFQLLQGAPVFSGKILGGCIDTLFDIFDGTRYADMPVLCARYGLFPPAVEWKGRILLLESSEEKMTPEKYRQALEHLKRTGLFRQISGILMGKPMDEAYDGEYRRLLIEAVDDPELPVLANINIGHAQPRCILPFGVEAHVDAEKQEIVFSFDS